MDADEAPEIMMSRGSGTCRSSEGKTLIGIEHTDATS
jgi:hypothetical protein